jgi:alpha-tubulin suppressor-like RCC1 family protein
MNDDSNMPVPVSGGLNFTTVSAGFEYSCGVTTTGAAYCWGQNGGQLGNETTNDSNVPVMVGAP